MDERLIEAIRAKYQYKMKESVSKIGMELKNPSKDAIEVVDSFVNDFSRTKEKE